MQFELCLLVSQHLVLVYLNLFVILQQTDRLLAPFLFFLFRLQEFVHQLAYQRLCLFQTVVELVQMQLAVLVLLNLQIIIYLLFIRIASLYFFHFLFFALVTPANPYLISLLIFLWYLLIFSSIVFFFFNLIIIV